MRKEMVRIGVVGGRDFNDVDKLTDYLDTFIARFDRPDGYVTIISGGANGADTLAQKYAIKRGLTYKEYPADWLTYGKSAGFRRNKQIVNDCHALVAFWDGKSKGTKSSINIAREQEKAFTIVHY